MADRVIVGKSEIIGSVEWADRLTNAIKNDFTYAERDVSLLAEHAAVAKSNKIWLTVYGSAGGSWEQYCKEHVNLPASFIDAMIVGVGLLRAQGYDGWIPAEHAQRVAAMASTAIPPMTPQECGKLGGRGNKAMDNSTQLSNPGGNSTAALTKRIAGERPDILEAMKQGKYRSVRAAAIDAGIVKPSQRYSLPDTPEAAGRYLAERVDRAWLEAMIDAYTKAIED